MNTHTTLTSPLDGLPPHRLAFIVDDGDNNANALLRALIAERQASGWRIRGLLRDDGEATQGAAHTMRLLDVATGQRIGISQDLGALSTSCSIDENALAQASMALRLAMEAWTLGRLDLVVVNRFGKLEAEGRGFADDLLTLMAEGVPLLVIVGCGQVAEWQTFTGGSAVEVPAREQALRAWLDALPATA